MEAVREAMHSVFLYHAIKVGGGQIFLNFAHFYFLYGKFKYVYMHNLMGSGVTLW